MQNTQSISDCLRTQGYVRFNVREYVDVDGGALAALSEEFRTLPPDPYGRERGRYRRYARGVLIPWTRHLAWAPDGRDSSDAPIATYFQGSYNPEFKDLYRHFPALSAAAKSNPLLHELILTDFQMTFWRDEDIFRPLHVGIHFVKLTTDYEGERAVATPDSLHQDGEPFTFAHLIVRRNVAGGANSIAPAHCAGLRPDDLRDHLIIDRFELVQPLESYGVYDALVSHHVSAVLKGPAPEPAERGVILIDFTPLIPAPVQRSESQLPSIPISSPLPFERVSLELVENRGSRT